MRWGPGKRGLSSLCCLQTAFETCSSDLQPVLLRMIAAPKGPAVVARRVTQDFRAGTEGVTPQMSRIPNEYHFIYGLDPGFGDRPFSMIHYLAVASCRAVNKPDRINFYHGYEPSGSWWEKTRPLVNLVKIQPPQKVFGIPLAHVTHRADVLRLQILIERGGIYLDVDVLCLRPFADLQHFAVVLGEEYNVGLCNAVILAEPGSRFLKEWLESYRSYRSDEWNEHSVRQPRKLAERMSEVHVLDHKKFFWPMYNHGNDLREFFIYEGSAFCAESYCVHLWESLTWEFVSKLTVDDLWTINSEFCRIARKYFNPPQCLTESAHLFSA